MPVTKGIGNSDITPIKESYLVKVLKIHIPIALNVINKNKNWCDPNYYFFDLNAGSGYNNEQEISGSPILFLDTARNYVDSKFKAIFIEIDSGIHRELSDRIAQRPTSKNIVVNIHHGDFSNVMLQYIIKPTKYGLVYHDPNGIFNNKFLENLFKNPSMSMLDVLINCNSQAIKRNHYAFGTETLQEKLFSIPKKNWLIRDIFGHWQWTFLLGTNWQSHEKFKTNGFHLLDSPIGQKLWKTICYSATDQEIFKDSYQDEFKLPYSSWQEYTNSPYYRKLRLRRFNFANNICEQCHANKVEHLHHIIYPIIENGEVDQLNNVIAVCKICHTKIHLGNEKEIDIVRDVSWK